MFIGLWYLSYIWQWIIVHYLLCILSLVFILRIHTYMYIHWYNNIYYIYRVNIPREVMFCYQSFVQLLDVDPQDQAEEEGANVDLDSQRKGKCAVIKTSTRQVRPKEYIFSIN